LVKVLPGGRCPANDSIWSIEGAGFDKVIATKLTKTRWFEWPLWRR
jgi:hypothetical protein